MGFGFCDVLESFITSVLPYVSVPGAVPVYSAGGVEDVELCTGRVGRKRKVQRFKALALCRSKWGKNKSRCTHLSRARAPSICQGHSAT